MDVLDSPYGWTIGGLVLGVMGAWLGVTVRTWAGKASTILVLSVALWVHAWGLSLLEIERGHVLADPPVGDVHATD